MIEIKHTEGPWSLAHFADINMECKCGYVFSEHQQGMGAICTINSGQENESHDIAKANAHLISAAPELLSEIKSLRDTYVSIVKSSISRIVELGGTCDSPEYILSKDECLKNVDAVIAKAEGKQND